MKKELYDGWYFFADPGQFVDIEYRPNGIGSDDVQLNVGDYKHAPNAYGPYKTFGEAKRQAILMFQADLELAKMNIRKIRTARKDKSFFKGPRE